MPVLFAEFLNWEGLTVNGLFTLVGGAVVYFLGWYDRKQDRKAILAKERAKAKRDAEKEDREEERKDEAITITQWQEYAARIEKNEEKCQELITRQNKRIDDLLEEIICLRTSMANLWGWIRYGVSLLRANNIVHDPPPSPETEP